MNGKKTKAANQVRSNDTTRLTARGELDEDGNFSVEYEHWGRTYQSVDELEAALRGEAWD